MTYTDTSVYDAAAALLECVRAAVEPVTGVPLGRVCVVPGDIAFDGCDCDGALYASWRTSYDSAAFPAPQEAPRNCGAPYAVGQIGLALARCVPVVDERGYPPTCAELADAARLHAREAYWMRRAALECLCSMRRSGVIAEYLIGAQVPVGPQGGCAGIAMDVTIGWIR